MAEKNFEYGASSLTFEKKPNKKKDKEFVGISEMEKPIVSA